MEYFDLNKTAGNGNTGANDISLPDFPQTVTGVSPVSAANITLTVDELIKIIQGALSSLRVYVVESDITDAQNSVKTIVEQSKF